MTEGRHAQVVDGARERYSDGENCAQSVIGALAETPGLPPLSPSLGAGFTTGIGHKGCVCGALVGGVAVLSEYASRQGLKPAAAQKLAEELAASLHTGFEQQFGATCCRVIKRGQAVGSDEWLSHCATLTEETARMVAHLVEEHDSGANRARWALRDVLSSARRVGLDGLAGAGITLLIAIVLPRESRIPFIFGGTAALATLGLAFELGAPLVRRIARYLRTVGAAAAALLALAIAISPATTSSVADLVLGDSPSMGAARVLFAAFALVVAVSSAFMIKRYR